MTTFDVPAFRVPDSPSSIAAGNLDPTQVWGQITTAARAEHAEPTLKPLLDGVIARSDTLAEGLTRLMAEKIEDGFVSRAELETLFAEVLSAHPSIVAQAADDLAASVERNPAYPNAMVPFLFAKGYVGLQIHRCAHELWNSGRTTMASHLQSRVSEVLGIDIHPAARIGTRVFIDHATGVVIGETAVVGDDTSILQGVTLGGTGKESGDRHPKVGRGVLLSAGVNVIGNVRIGDYAKIGAGSVVLHEVPPHATVVGVPARVVRTRSPEGDCPGRSMDQSCD